MLEYLFPLFNHLWQSTVFAVVAGLLTLAFRKSHAGTRYWLWLAASVKFLVPFYLLVIVGSHIQWRTGQALASPESPFAMEQISRSFIAPLAITRSQPVEIAAAASPIPALLFLLWACGFIAVLFVYWLRWRRVHLARRQAGPLDLTVSIKVMSSSVLLEPAVFGIFRPVLLLPEGITAHLTPAQLEAIFAHELCHIRRRDNLMAALHMVVEAVFWFYPLVWWLGARLIDERERACDEAVVQSGNEPRVYAEAILEVCKFYLESPLKCAAGVSGANLKKRIETIMIARPMHKPSLGGKLLLATAGVLALAIPFIVGFVNAPPRQARLPQTDQAPHSIEQLSVKLSASTKPVPGFADDVPANSLSPGNFTVKYASLRNLIQQAYHVRDFQIAGGPGWIDSHDYQIAAKAADNPTMRDWGNAISAMLQTLLKDRFRLKFHHETRQLPVYVLMVAKSGLTLERSKEGSCAPVDWNNLRPPGPEQKASNFCGIGKAGLNIRLNHTLNAAGASIAGAPTPWGSLTGFLSVETHRPVIDKTGLKGSFDFHLEWNEAATAAALAARSTGANPGKPALPVDPDNPSIFTAVEQQLGLQLEPDKGPVEVLVVDQAEKPSVD